MRTSSRSKMRLTVFTSEWGTTFLPRTSSIRAMSRWRRTSLKRKINRTKILETQGTLSWKNSWKSKTLKMCARLSLRGLRNLSRTEFWNWLNRTLSWILIYWDLQGNIKLLPSKKKFWEENTTIKKRICRRKTDSSRIGLINLRSGNLEPSSSLPSYLKSLD
jgi:hypothetical protein